jgi:alpha/beta superfamily hydrolase
MSPAAPKKPQSSSYKQGISIVMHPDFRTRGGMNDKHIAEYIEIYFITENTFILPMAMRYP